jgi:hypothetical protein
VRVTAPGGDVVVDTGREAPVLVMLERMRRVGLIDVLVEPSPTQAVRLRGRKP